MEVDKFWWKQKNITIHSELLAAGPSCRNPWSCTCGLRSRCNEAPQTCHQLYIDQNLKIQLSLPDQVLDPFGFSGWVDGDGVHAELAAVVPRPLPVKLGVGARLQPGEVVPLTKPLCMDHPCKFKFQSQSQKRESRMKCWNGTGWLFISGWSHCRVNIIPKTGVLLFSQASASGSLKIWAEAGRTSAATRVGRVSIMLAILNE